MSLAKCDGCDVIVDTDAETEVCVYAEDYSFLKEDGFLCYGCRKLLEKKE